jgi:putative transport protein
MHWLTQLQQAQPVAHGVLVLSLVAALGLALGNLKLRGLGLGVAGTLFAGILLGHFGMTMDHAMLDFVREFGLILFVYTIGMQVGPGFLNSLRKQGLPLNLAAAAIVLLGAATTIALCLALGIDFKIGVGILSGAVTNTPSLGAGQEALRSLGFAGDELAKPGMGYAVAYPFGIIGIIVAMLVIRFLFRVSVPGELEAFRKAQRAGQESLQHLNLVVENRNLEGLQVRQLPGIGRSGVVISRLRSAGDKEPRIAKADTVLHQGDVLVAVGTRRALDEFRVIVGRETSEDLTTTPGPLVMKRLVVTHKEAVGSSLRELALNHRYGVTVSRVTRADMDIGVTADLHLQFGDMLRLVGTEADIARAAAELGNSVQELNHAKLVPMFVGIALGVLFGSWPVMVGNMPAPLKLGLAGGPLLIAIILSRVGRIGPLLWYLPANANILLREFGIVLFLSAVGLKAGEKFVATLIQGGGWVWMGVGAVITLLPLLVVGMAMRGLFKLNYMNLCGLLSGSMTDPPALAFANNISASDAPSVAYATVYPLTMILRILVAQLIVLYFCR